MAKEKMREPTFTDLSTSTKDLIKMASTFKSGVLKKKFRNETLGNEYVDLVCTLNVYLRQWETVANDTKEAMKGATPKEGVYALEYSFAKPYIYAKYDYASVLPFADGIYKGIKDKKFEETEDIEDFRYHTASLAFKNCADTTAGMLDEIATDADSRKAAGKLEVSLFNSVRRSQKFFNSHDRVEIYNSVKKTLEYMVNNLGGLKINDSYKANKLLISAVNNITDYAVYSAVAYACRVYVLSNYVMAFVSQTADAVEPKDESVMTEGAIQMPDEHPGCNSCIHIMKDMDDAKMTSLACARDFFKGFDDFLVAAEVAPKIGYKPTYRRGWINARDLKDNKFKQALSENQIYLYLTEPDNPLNIFGINTASEFDELVVVFRDFMYDHKLALPDANSPREEMLHVIRGVDAEHGTLKEYQDLAEDLYMIALQVTKAIEECAEKVARWETQEKNEPTTNVGSSNNAAECLRILNYMYREFTRAILQKARYIEAKINSLKAEDLNKAIAGTQLHIPGLKKDEPDLDAYMTIAVPDSVKMPTGMMDLYALPVFESYELYDEYLRTLPEFANDMYLSEAFNLSEIWNAIMAFIQGRLKSVQTFFNNQSVKGAINWVQKNGNTLKQADFTGKSMEALPYKSNIDMSSVFNNIMSATGTFGTDNKDTAESMKKMLYPSETVAGWFDKDQKEGAAKYRNYILFQDEANATAQEIKPVTYEGQALKTKVGEWVGTVAGAANNQRQYEEWTRQLNGQLNMVKTKVANMANANAQEAAKQPAQTQATQAPDIKEAAETTPTTATQQTTAQSTTQTTTQQGQTQQNNQQANQTNDANQNLNAIVTETQKAINLLWGPATDMLIETIRNQYSYLQQAYKLVNQ